MNRQPTEPGWYVARMKTWSTHDGWAVVKVTRFHWHGGDAYGPARERRQIRLGGFRDYEPQLVEDPRRGQVHGHRETTAETLLGGLVRGLRTDYESKLAGEPGLEPGASGFGDQRSST